MIEQVRAFNRFYTRRIGVISERLLDSAFSLAEVRVLYELAHREEPTASELARDLGLDAGYLSRILRGFEGQELIERRPSAADGRQSLLSLTARGRAVFDPLDAGARDQIGALLRELSAVDQERLIEAMGTIERLL